MYEDLEEHIHQGVIHGHHIYKDIWSPYIGEPSYHCLRV